jgi:hypothetical protein
MNKARSLLILMLIPLLSAGVRGRVILNEEEPVVHDWSHTVTWESDDFDSNGLCDYRTTIVTAEAVDIFVLFRVPASTYPNEFYGWRYTYSAHSGWGGAYQTTWEWTVQAGGPCVVMSGLSFAENWKYRFQTADGQRSDWYYHTVEGIY